MITVHPGPVQGTIAAPSSKSVAQRAIAIASLAEAPSTIKVTELCDDTRASISAATALGAGIQVSEGTIAVNPDETTPQSQVDCFESGLCLRMFSPIAALFGNAVEMRAAGSLLKRSQATVEDTLIAMGVSCKTEDGLPPIQLQGPLRGQSLTLDASSTSQLLTGLLIALPRAPGDSRLVVENLASKPYIGLTLQMLDLAGARIDRDRSFSEFSIPGNQRYSPLHLTVEGDWSQAAFWLVAGAVTGDVSVHGLNLNSKQSDRAVLGALEQAGAAPEISHDSVRTKNGELVGFDIDLTHCPDLFPPLAVLAAGSAGQSRLKGTGRLKNKESDRVTTIHREMTKIGANITLEGDSMLITGGALQGGRVQAHGDHRIAMALSIAALICKESVQIEGHQSVTKSYPGFFDDLKQIGAKIS